MFDDTCDSLSFEDTKDRPGAKKQVDFGGQPLSLNDNLFDQYITKLSLFRPGETPLPCMVGDGGVGCAGAVPHSERLTAELATFILLP